MSLGRLVFTILYILAFPLALLWLAGDFAWPEGWAFFAWFVGISALTIGYLWRKDPALLAERYRKPGTGGQKGWDVWIVHLLGVGFLAWIVIMPLDAKRFHWSPELPLWLRLVGGALLLPAAFFFFRAFTDNPFLSALVRVQSERRQRVVSTGVYGLVRHPMYLGASMLYVGTPLLLGSLWGLLLGASTVVLLMVRILGEEKALLTELEGYAEYRNQVRYRLLPFVW